MNKKYLILLAVVIGFLFGITFTAKVTEDKTSSNKNLVYTEVFSSTKDLKLGDVLPLNVNDIHTKYTFEGFTNANTLVIKSDKNIYHIDISEVSSFEFPKDKNTRVIIRGVDIPNNEIKLQVKTFDYVKMKD